ncbi:Ger(x)C family spore germination protein [Paenibacillus sp. TRM 82003]|nr:Ger(x)C family spore germination protein [Paenibacillus sp. TRM 82003]
MFTYRRRTLRAVAATLSLCCLLLTGCWDRVEVNDIAIVSGSAIDLEDDMYRLSVQFPLAGQLGGTKDSGGSGVKWYMDSGKGKTIRDAHNKLQLSVSRKLYYAHRRVLLFGEAAAKAGTAEMVDIVARIPQNRITTMVFVADGQAADVLSVETPLEQSTADAIREIGVLSAGIPRTLKHFIDFTLSDGIEAAVPYVGVRESDPGKESKPKPGIVMKGMALFRDDKMVGTIDPEESRTFLWVINQANTSEVTVDLPNHGPLTLMFQETEASLRPFIRNGEVEMSMKFKARAIVLDNESDYSSVTDDLSLLREHTEKEVRRRIRDLVEKLQNEKHADAIGFGDAIYRKYPERWHELRDVWYDYAFRTLPVHVDVAVQVESPGTIIRPMGDKKEETP